MNNFISLAEAACRLDLSEQRVYQLDDVLYPTKVQRGEKMVTRWYDPEVVEAFRVERESTKAPNTSCGADAAAREIAAARLTEYANTAPFFWGVAPADTEDVRERIRKIARRLV